MENLSELRKEASRIQLAVFKKNDDYNLWRRNALNALKLHCSWGNKVFADILTNEEDDLLYNILQRFLSYDVIEEESIDKCSSDKGINLFTALDNQYSVLRRKQKVKLLKEFLLTRCNDMKEIGSFISRKKELSRKLHDVSIDELLILSIAANVPTQCKSVVDSLLVNDELTYEKLKSSLIDLTDEYIEMDEKEKVLATHSQHGKSKTRKEKTVEPERASSSRDIPHRHCIYCGKQNHFAIDCWHWKTGAGNYNTNNNNSYRNNNNNNDKRGKFNNGKQQDKGKGKQQNNGKGKGKGKGKKATAHYVDTKAFEDYCEEAEEDFEEDDDEDDGF